MVPLVCAPVSTHTGGTSEPAQQRHAALGVALEMCIYGCVHRAQGVGAPFGCQALTTYFSEQERSAAA